MLPPGTRFSCWKIDRPRPLRAAEPLRKHGRTRSATKPKTHRKGGSLVLYRPEAVDCPEGAIRLRQAEHSADNITLMKLAVKIPRKNRSRTHVDAERFSEFTGSASREKPLLGG